MLHTHLVIQHCVNPQHVAAGAPWWLALGAKSRGCPPLISPQYSEKQMTFPLAQGESLVASMNDT